MSTDHLIFFSVPGLRPKDIDAQATPTLYHWANTGALADLVPTFPCVTSPVQASMLTGLPPSKHGVIANGFFDRDRGEVEFWVAHNKVIEGEQIWDAIRARRPGFTSAVWHAQNIKGASADFIVTPAPLHEPDGTTKLWCYSKPDGLYQQLLDAMGHFPLQHYWGPLANIESTRWILRAALWLIERHAPNFHWIYLPHLDYAAQKFGPNTPQSRTALSELDHELYEFAAGVGRTVIGRQVVYLAAGEYAMTDVKGAIFPNRVLRDAGLLKIREVAGREYVDLRGSSAFAMVDHQLAHVYVSHSDPQARARSVNALSHLPGMACAAADSDRAQLGIDHPRAGDVVLVADDAHWFAYYWWLDDAKAPAFARTVDIHRKPGYDPVELFFDPTTRSIPLNAALVKGSHGIPATQSRHRAALVCSTASPTVETGETFRDTDIKRICRELMGLGSR